MQMRNRKVSYRKQIARQHSSRNLCQDKGVGDPVKFLGLIHFNHQAKFGCCVTPCGP